MKKGLKWGKTEGGESRKLLLKSQNTDVLNCSKGGEEQTDELKDRSHIKERK